MCWWIFCYVKCHFQLFSLLIYILLFHFDFKFAEIVDIFPKSGVLYQWVSLPDSDSSCCSCCTDVFFWENWIWYHKPVRVCFQSHSWGCFSHCIPISGNQFIFSCHRSTGYVVFLNTSGTKHVCVTLLRYRWPAQISSKKWWFLVVFNFYFKASTSILQYNLSCF